MPGHGRQKKRFLKKIGIGLSKKKSYRAECPLNGDPIWVPVSASQIRIEKSSFPPLRFSNPPPLTIFVPQGEKHTERTRSLCPLSVDTHVPVDVSQILMLSSQLPLATCLPSGLKETLETRLESAQKSAHTTRLKKSRSKRQWSRTSSARSGSIRTDPSARSRS